MESPCVSKEDCQANPCNSKALQSANPIEGLSNTNLEGPNKVISFGLSNKEPSIGPVPVDEFALGYMEFNKKKCKLHQTGPSSNL